MLRNAVQKAERCYYRAADAVDRLRYSTDVHQGQDAWEDFLDQANRVFQKLEKGSKHNGKSTAWFGRIAHVRRKDPLLRYLHQARNSEEHTIAGSSKTSMGIGARGSVHLKQLIVVGGQVYADWTPQNPESQLLVNFSLDLLPVTDERFGDTFNPPTEHLGAPITDTSPLGVAVLALNYLRRVIQEARAFIK